jgi:hypothetical protein
MRRTAKPFIVEVKRNSRKRTSGDEPGDTALVPPEPVSAHSLRFREAETMFRSAGEVAESPVHRTAPASRSPAAAGKDAKPGRVLPDLIAEAALAEQAVDEPVVRRRGRPPKSPDALPAPKKPRAEVDAPPAAEADEMSAAPAYTVPVVLIDLAASRRRRSARSTEGLPRGERWKRRLPKVCW